MIIFIENMQKLRVSNAASCKNIRFELQLKRSKRSFITHITYLNSQLLLLYIVQSYFGHYGNMWSGCSITFAPYIHFQLKIKCIASVTHRRHAGSKNILCCVPAKRTIALRHHDCNSRQMHMGDCTATKRTTQNVRRPD